MNKYQRFVIKQRTMADVSLNTKQQQKKNNIIQNVNFILDKERLHTVKYSTVN